MVESEGEKQKERSEERKMKSKILENCRKYRRQRIFNIGREAASNFIGSVSYLFTNIKAPIYNCQTVTVIGRCVLGIGIVDHIPVSYRQPYRVKTHLLEEQRKSKERKDKEESAELGSIIFKLIINSMVWCGLVW